MQVQQGLRYPHVSEINGVEVEKWTEWKNKDDGE